MIEKLNYKECVHLLNNNYIGYLSYVMQNIPYVVPVTYFFDDQNENLIYYSAEGQKINAMRKYDIVSMLVTEIRSMNSWDSVLVHGKFNELEGINAKAKLHDFSLGLKDLIMIKEHKKMSYISEFSNKMHNGKAAIVYEINDLEITGRRRSE